MLTNRPKNDDIPTIVMPPGAGDGLGAWHAGAALEESLHILDVRGGRGVSGMGIVYIVEHQGQLFAVKTFQRRFAQDLLFIQRFIREALTWMLVGFHPNVVRAYQLDIIHAVPCLFMEYVDSDAQGDNSLADLIRRGPLPMERILNLAIQCCRGMAHASAAVPGLVHRDLKPENLLISPEGVLKVTDFGLVRCRGDHEDPLRRLVTAEVEAGEREKLTAVGSIFGTPAYMAPEQFAEADQVSCTADIYAWGCTFYEAVTGSPPFVAAGGTTLERLAVLKRKHVEAVPEPLRARRPDCPPELEAMVMKALEKHPVDRWQHFTELGDRLMEVARELDCHAPVPPRVDPSAREVAAQMRSLGVLAGYDRAIRLRRLRENQDLRPYAFHLALASYFHCQEDAQEERRQLEKAARARSVESGYEVARRLAEIYLAEGEVLQAETLVADFLAEHPSEEERVLEPRIHLLCAQHRFEEAERVLDGRPSSPRIVQLRAEVLKSNGRRQDLARLLREAIAANLDTLEKSISRVTPASVTGWEEEGDRERLQAVMGTLRPGVDCSALDTVASTVWPELTGDPQFDGDMAWLSEHVGELSAIEDNVDAEERSLFKEVAQVLGYPRRLRRHLRRDECWFWEMHPAAFDDHPAAAPVKHR